MDNDSGTVHNEQFEGKDNTNENTEEIKKQDNIPNKESSSADNEDVSTGSLNENDENEGALSEVKEEETGEVAEEETLSEVKEEETEEVTKEEIKENKEEVNSKSEDNTETEAEPIDYSECSKAELVEELEKVLQTENADSINKEIEIIKSHFYKKHNTEIDTLKEKFLEEGGNIEDFKPVNDGHEVKLKELISNYREKKAEINKLAEEDKHTNLEIKHRVIEDIKELVNRKESINKTFQEFRDLQQEWRNTGLVPQQNVKDLWESYHLACEMFYDYIKINKELRDLDLKKNLEAKIALCEKAEKLLLEPSVVNSFKILQTYHDQWREIGPVPPEKKTEIWERFKEITSKINKRHHQYFENLKDNQKKNLEEKRVLCEKVEEINSLTLSSAKEWEERSREIIEIQKTWKTIGFAPKKDNNSIYQRFRTACDYFFNNKREFFSLNKEEQKNNLQIKTDLCVQAESMKDSTDWRNTTEQLISLQKRWKEIGPVPKKYSDQIWERFRSACDEFFNRKSKFFSNKDESYDENLKLKQNLIKEIKDYKLVSDVEQNFENISKYQKQWTEIGFVPIEKKDEIQNDYRDAINELFDKLKVDDHERNILKFNNKLNDILSKPNASQKLRQEKEKLIKRLTTIENDIVVWENNIGFFSDSKNADSLIKDVKTKIDNGKSSIALLNEKIRAIEKFCRDNNID